MAFVNLTLLLGGAAVAIPVVLHLVMRQKPKTVEFPAVMFLQARKESNRRRLQLRHWILLALRCLGVLLLAAALARPSVAAALWGNWIIVGVLAALAVFVGVIALLAGVGKRGKLLFAGLASLAGVLLLASLIFLVTAIIRTPENKVAGEEAPVAAVVLVDTAPRMQYRHHNQTRLAKAQQIAAWLLTQLPDQSDVAIADSNLGAAVFAVDRGAAVKGLESLAIDAASRPLADVLPQALELLAESQQQRRELYIFTDLAEPAWPEELAGLVSTRRGDVENLAVYVIDVGVEAPNNFALGDVQLARQVLPRNGVLEIGATIEHVGAGGERVVELEIEKHQPDKLSIVDGVLQLPDVDPAKRRRQTVNIGAGGSAAAQFSVAGLDVGTHHGRIRLDRADGLTVDDIRYFTFDVQEPWPVLVAYGPDARPELFTEAIAPYEFRVTEQARFRPKVIPAAELERYDASLLANYAAVCLLDPPPLPPKQWNELAAYAQQGGNVALFLGHNASKSNFNDDTAQELLPGRLDRQWRSGIRPAEFDGRADIYLAPRALEHSMLAAFRDIAANVPWADFPVFRHWSFEGGRLREGASVPLRFSNGQPAVVLSRLGQGSVLVMTTPVSDTARPAGRESWNWLPTGFEPWPYVMLVNEMMLFLAGSGDGDLNYFSGQSPQMKVPSGESAPYLLFTPDAVRSQTVRPDDGVLRFPYAAAPGNYRLKATDRGELLGFSVNLPAEASNLSRIDKAQLDAMLGADEYKIARELDELVREQGEQRAGKEFFPALVIILVIVLGLESLLSNRFYRND